MKELNAAELRALIRLIAPLRALREDVEKSIHLELHTGAGDLAVRSYRGLRDSVAAITDDPYVHSLEFEVDEGARDRQKMSLVMLASGQLLAYIEGQTGLTGLTSAPRGSYSVQTAPNIHVDVGDVMGGEVDRVMDMVGNALRGIPRPPRPPRPPEPPEPPRGHRGPRKRRETWEFEIHEDDENDEA